MKIEASRILVIATRQIGDTLLTTPLLRSLRHGYPEVRIEVLAYENTDGMLAGNPDIDAVITVAEHPNLPQYRRLLSQIFRRYDLVVSTLPGDRPTVYAWLAAPRRVNLVPPLNWQSLWKRWLAYRWAETDGVNTHTVVQNLRLADLLEIPRCYTVVPPCTNDLKAIDMALSFPWRTVDYAVLHPVPMWRYKRWTAAGWRALARHLLQRGLQVVVTGSGRPAEIEHIGQLLADDSLGIVNAAGRLSLAQLAEVLRRARLYGGPDTAVTHMAAATGTPTVAIYGPTNPVKWGPWPAGWVQDHSPYVRHLPQQQARNVLLLQGPGECVPCHREGCERHRESHSRCLDELPLAQVITATDHMLNWNEHHAPLVDC